MLSSYAYKGAWRHLRRLQGMSLRQRLRYVLRVLVGETLPTRALGVFGLRLVEISLTDRCQCRCAHCYAATKAPVDELAAAEVETLLDDLARLGVTEVCFSGGEPLLYPDILPLVASASEKGFLVRLISNGIALDENMVTALKRAGLGYCSLSLDGSTPAIHDAFRCYPGCFDTAIDGLRYLIRHDVPCSIITVARRELVKSKRLYDIVKLGKDLGVSVVRINFPVPLGRFKDQHSEVLTLNERQEVRKLLRYGNVTMESPREMTTCKAGVTKVNVLPNGDVTPCVFVPIPYGNIRKDRFADIWEAMHDYSRLFKIKGQCPVCDPAMCARIFDTAEARGRLAEERRMPS